MRKVPKQTREEFGGHRCTLVVVVAIIGFFALAFTFGPRFRLGGRNRPVRILEFETSVFVCVAEERAEVFAGTSVYRVASLRLRK